MPTAVKLALQGVVIVLAALAANWGHDLAYRVNALVVMIAAAVAFLWTMGRESGAPMPNGHPAPATGYMDDVIRAGVIATALWGVVGFLAGTYIAFQLAFPVLNGGPMTVLHVGEDDGAVRQPGRDVMEHLSRHGIRAELLVLPPAGRPVAEVLLEIADVSGSGLLVMGAYEHSRLGETLFGGPTRDVLRQSKIPVLVAH